MRKILCFALLFILFLHFDSFASYLVNVPQTLTQPDGKIIHCFATGDEFYNWLHDENQFTIIQSNDGYYYYAALNEKGNLIPTTYKVGSIKPETVGLVPGINISNERKEEIRMAFYYKSNSYANLSISKNRPKSANNGTLNNIVIFIRFSDDAEFSTDSTVYYNLFNNVSGSSSLKNYFKEVSYNSLTVQSTFYPIHTGNIVVSYQDPHPRGYYQQYNATTNTIGYQGGDNGSQRANREDSLLAAAVNAINGQVPTGLNIDNDNDGNVDNVCFIAKGTPMGWNSLLWPHRWSLYLQNAYINGKKVSDYNFQLESYVSPSGVGVLCHEMFHTLGAPDLYHYSGDGFNPVGNWDLMESNSNPPESMGAYMKFRYGKWINQIPEITTNGTYSLLPITSPTNNCYKIKAGTSSKEYFVLEYRKREGVFESSIYASGLLIYRINTTVVGSGNMNGPPDEVYIYRQDGTLSQNGTLGTAFFNGNIQRTQFNSNTNPNPFLSNGFVENLNIYNISQSGSAITFTVGGMDNPFISIDSASNITSVSANIYTSIDTKGIPSHVELEYGNSISYGNSVDLSLNSINSNQTQVFSKNIVALQSGSDYHVRLKVTNSKGNFYSQDFLFNTQCSSDTLPIIQEFNSISKPTCWDSYIECDPKTPGANNGDASITFVSSGLNPTISSAYEGKYCVKFNSYDASDGAIARINSPSFSTLGKSNLSVNFRWYTSNLGNATLYPLEGVSVHWSSNGNTWNNVGFYPRYDAVTGWKLITANLPVEANNLPNIKISLKFYSQYGYNCYLDNVIIKYSGPAAEFSVNKTNIIQTDTVSFSDLSLSNLSSRNWIFPEATISSSTAAFPQTRYNNVGSFPVTLNVGNANGFNSMTKNNLINVSPLVSAGNDVSIVCSDSIPLQASLLRNIGSSNTQYHWSPSQGLSNPNIANPVASPLVTTTYTVTASDTNFTSTDTLIVKVEPLQIRTLNSAFINCKDSIKLNFSTNYPEGLFIKCNSPIKRKFSIGVAEFGISPIGCYANGSISYPIDNCGGHDACCSTPYNIGSLSGKIVLIDKGSCSYITQVYAAQKGGAIGVIIVNNTTGLVNPLTFSGIDTVKIPVVMITQKDGDTLKNWITAYGNVIVSIGYEGPPLTCTWSPTSGLSNIHAFQPYAAPLTNTTYTVTVSNGICTESAQIQVGINSPKLNLGDDTLICNSGTYTLNALQQGCTYQWNNGATTPAINIAQSGNYSLKITNALGCYYSDSIKVSFNITPADLSSVIGIDSILETPSPNIYTVSPTTGNPDYFWALLPDSAGTLLQNTNTISIAWNPSFDGNAQINVRAGNECGSTSTISKNITLIPKTLHVNLILEGLFDPNTNIMHEAMNGNTSLPQFGNGIADLINIRIHPEYHPNLVTQEIQNTFLSTSGNINVRLQPIDSTNYYIEILHRNHVTVWSAVPVSFNNKDISYQFSSSMMQAFQNSEIIPPQIQLSMDKFGLHAGDIDHNRVVDLDDFVILEPDLTYGSIGFLNTDLNGSGYVDLEDFIIFEPKLTSGIVSQSP